MIDKDNFTRVIYNLTHQKTQITDLIVRDDEEDEDERFNIPSMGQKGNNWQLSNFDIEKRELMATTDTLGCRSSRKRRRRK